MQCRDCIHWAQPRSVESLPDYPIGFCGIFQKDVAGEFAGCAGRFFLDRDQKEWSGTLREIESSAHSPLDIPENAKIVSISPSTSDQEKVKVVFLIPKKH